MSSFQHSLKNPVLGTFRRRFSGQSWAKPPVWAILAIWAERARARRQLAQLDDRLLRDIGLSPADIQREILKPFWSE